MRVPLSRHVVVRNVGAVDDLLVGEEVELPDYALYRVRLLARERADALALLEVLEERGARLRLGTQRGLGLRLLPDAVVALLELLHVSEDEFGLDDLRIADGVDGRGLVSAFLDVDDVVVLEAADDMEDRVALADVREELVSEALALRRALDESGDVGELHRRADYLLRVDDLRELIETGVRHFDDGGVGLDGAERIVLRRGLLALGERVEQCRLADVGKSDDSY